MQFLKALHNRPMKKTAQNLMLDAVYLDVSKPKFVI